MPEVVMTLKKHMGKPITFKLMAEEIGVSEDQLEKMSRGVITSLNRLTLANIIAFMRVNGHPNFGIADLLEYVEDD